MVRVLVIVILASLSAAAVAPAIAAAPGKDAQRQELRRNAALWARQNLRDYRFRLRVQCFCPGARQAVTVTVVNGRPRGSSPIQKRFDTFAEQFTAIGRVLEDPGAGDVSVTYDARRGFPRRAAIDPIKTAIDDEQSWTVDRFRPLRPRALTTR